MKWARDKRDELFLLMGGACKRCGTGDKLQFDHIKPLDWIPSAFSWSQRIKMYQEEHQAGNLQLLCDSCHGKKTREQEADEEIEEHPF